MRPCPSSETLAGRPMDDSLAEHVAGCPDCSAALAATTPLGGGKPAVPTEPAVEPVQGARFGRYTIDRLLGSGGIGVVYVAVDHELGRKVALKVLREADAAAEARLVREAQAMARLAHPNVLVVHEAGTVGGRVYIASELVDGMSLDRWVKAAPRPWRDVLAVYLQAGRGLSAAHAAGIVHRDVKPANIFVGADGRARVGDFGLARAELTAEPESPPSVETAASLTSDPGLTMTGALVGTPAYMAPEQRRGEQASARSDQWSFCLALHEGLTGTRLARGAAPVYPRRLRLPARLRAALARGLDPDRERRFPTMDALLAVLESAAARPRRALGAGVCAVAAIAGIAGAAVMRRAPAGEVCRGAELKLAGVWDDPVKRATRATFAATGRANAEETYTLTARALDDKAAAWTAMRTEACAATAVRHEQSTALLDLRMECLDRRLDGVRALTTLFTAGPDAKLLDRAVQASLALGDLEPCADAKGLLAAYPAPDEPAVRAAVTALRPRMSTIAALQAAGRTRDALAMTLGALGEPRAVAYPPVRAELLTLLGNLQQEGDPRAAEAALQDAMMAAAAARDDRLAARALIDLVAIVGFRQRRFEDGRRLRPLAAAAIVRAGDPPLLRAALLSNLGIVENYAGDYDASRKLQEEALALRERALGPGHLELARSLNALATLESRSGNFGRATELLGRALAIFQKELGPGHPYNAYVLTNLVHAATELGHHDEALGLSEQAVALLEATMGKEHPAVAEALTNEAMALHGLGRTAEGAAIQERVVGIREKALPDSSELAAALSNLAETYAALGRGDEALAILQRSITIREKALGPKHPDLAFNLSALGELYLQRHEPRLALATLRRAEAIRLEAYGAENRRTAVTRARLAQAYVEMERPAEGLAAAEQALDVLVRHGGLPQELAEARFTTARALHAVGRDAARADELAREARAFYAGQNRPADAAAVTAWLDHRKR